MFLFLPRKGHEVWTEFISLRILATSLSRLSQRSLRPLREKKKHLGIRRGGEASETAEWRESFASWFWKKIPREPLGPLNPRILESFASLTPWPLSFLIFCYTSNPPTIFCLLTSDSCLLPFSTWILESLAPRILRFLNPSLLWLLASFGFWKRYQENHLNPWILESLAPFFSGFLLHL